MTRDPHSKKPRSFVLFALKWGFVLFLWGVLIGGLTLAWFAKDLDEITRKPNFERRFSITVLANDGSVIGRYGDIKGQSLTVDQLPQHLIHAVLAAEDRRFYYHFGIDPIGLTRAFVVNTLNGRVVQGGSTITQQLAKNLFLSQERTYKRKIQEALLAFWLERRLSKDDILAAYLNRIYMGAGAYGVDAASQIYFKKSAKDINLREAAILAGLIKAPSRFSPTSSPSAANRRADIVLQEMVEAGFLKEDLTQDKKDRPPIPLRKPDTAESSRYFADWCVEGMNALLGSPEADIIIKTTLDPQVQKGLTEPLVSTVQQEGTTSKISQGAGIVLRPDGSVVSMVGGIDYGQSQFNRVTQAMRSPGSSFKPVVYLTALEMGWKPTDTVMDEPFEVGSYRPTNFGGKYYGEVTLIDAMTLSLNTVAVQLAQNVGIDRVIGMARRLGITSPLESNFATALGANGATMLEMATAYLTISNDGILIRPFGILEITEEDGKVLYQRQAPQPSRVVSYDNVRDLKLLMESVVRYGTGQAAQFGGYAAGKTGTSQDYRDVWFSGFTNGYVASIWMGNDDNSSSKKVTGGALPARVWRQTMVSAVNDPSPAPYTRIDTGSNIFSDMLNRILTDEDNVNPQVIDQEDVRSGQNERGGFFSRWYKRQDNDNAERPSQPQEPRTFNE